MEKIKFMEIAKKLVAKNSDSTWNGSATYFNDKMTYTIYRNLFFKARTTAKQVDYKYINNSKTIKFSLKKMIVLNQ